jgi:putative ABC transport system substrate-binding protein
MNRRLGAGLSRRRLLRAAVCLGTAGAAASLLASCRDGSTAAEMARPARVPRIGYLGGPFEEHALVFRGALRELGWIEDENLVVDYGAGRDSNPEIPVRELLQGGAELLVAPSDGYVLAARAATSTVPIVMIDASDPVGMGLVGSLARPGGNVTGLSGYAPQLNGKRLQLLMDTVPELRRVAVWWNVSAPAAVANFRETEVAAARLGLELQSWQVDGNRPEAHDAFQNWADFDAARSGRAQALLVIKDWQTFITAGAIVNQAAQRGLPTILPFRRGMTYGGFLPPGFLPEMTEGLMAYAANEADLWRRAAGYVDKILRGARPAELPVEQPSVYDLILNLRVAALVGVTFPPGMLGQATEVIR